MTVPLGVVTHAFGNALQTLCIPSLYKGTFNLKNAVSELKRVIRQVEEAVGVSPFYAKN